MHAAPTGLAAQAREHGARPVDGHMVLRTTVFGRINPTCLANGCSGRRHLWESKQGRARGPVASRRSCRDPCPCGRAVLRTRACGWRRYTVPHGPGVYGDWGRVTRCPPRWTFARGMSALAHRLTCSHAWARSLACAGSHAYLGACAMPCV